MNTELLNAAVDAAIIDLVRKYNLAVETLTEKQLADAIRQAIEAGDFQRNVVTWDDAGDLGNCGAQSVTYLPWAEAERLRALYNELIYAVKTKYMGESPHEAALRYIQEREEHPPDAYRPKEAPPT